MDFSQLPKMSKTPAPPPQAEPPEMVASPTPSSAPPAYGVPYAGPGAYYARPGGDLISIWISLIVGLICLMLGWSFARWLAAKASGNEFATGVNWVAGPKAGQPVSYFELQGGT